MSVPGKLKIGVIVDNELNSDKRVLREIKILKDAGHEISVLCLGFRTEYKDPVEEIIISRIRINRRTKDILFFFQNLIPAYEWLWTNKIKKHILRFSPDVIHVHDLYMSKAGRKGIRKSGIKIPMVLDLHENYPYAVLSYNWTKGFLRQLISHPALWQKKEKEYLDYANGIVVLSDDFRDDLRERFPELSNIPFAVLPNVPDLSETERRSVVDLKVKFEENVTVLFYFGVVAERRGIFDVLEALMPLAIKNYPLRLLVIGPIDKKDSGRFFNIINSGVLRDKITYIPWIDASELPAYLSISDICLAPFKKNPHHDSGIANKVFDYMLGQKPVIASDCRPQKNLIEIYDCGIVYTNTEELKEAIIRLLKDPGLRKKMGYNGYMAIMNEYNINVKKNDLLSFYNLIK
jgi:glycosyltransferase involved in cell wall biosynthesis